jgi:transposase InsO family protein
MKKKHTGTQIVAKLRQADVLIGQGKTIPEVCKEIEVSEQTYYRWRQKYGGMNPAMVKELRGLHPFTQGGGRSGHRKRRPQGGGFKKLISPASRRQAIQKTIEKLGVSQRQACKALGQNRSTQRYELKMPEKDRLLTEAIRQQANKGKHRRYGYRRITEILCRLNGIVNHKRVYRIWRQQDLRLPQKRQKKKRYNENGLNARDRRPPEHMNHIWSYDIMEDKLENGRKVRILNVIDEFTRECLASEVAFSIKQHDVIELLRYLFLVRGCPTYLRSDNGSQFTAYRVKRFLKDLGVDTLFIEPGSPWENGYVESFNSRMRDDLLDGELFLHIDETKYVVERWRMDYNHYRPHSSLGYMTPAGFAELCRQAGCVRPHTPVLEGVQDCGILS